MHTFRVAQSVSEFQVLRERESRFTTDLGTHDLLVFACELGLLGVFALLFGALGAVISRTELWLQVWGFLSVAAGSSLNFRRLLGRTGALHEFN